VTWSASNGQGGKATVDEHGLVTAVGVTIQAGKPVTVTFQMDRLVARRPR
jgi:hypothetical protein